MTVAVQTPLNEYTANGATTVFAYTFEVPTEDDLTVYVDGVEQTSGFTVSGVGDGSGGAVTFTTAPADQSVVLLLRGMSAKRDTDYQNSGDFRADTVNDDFDNLWLFQQQLKRILDYQGLLFPETESRTPAINALPSPAPGQVLTWQANGSLNNSLIEDLVSSVTISSTIDRYSDLATFVTQSPSSSIALITSYYGGWAATVTGPKGGHFRHKTGATNTSPTVGSAVAVSTIGSGDQAGYCWDASGAEWYISTNEGRVDILAFGVTLDGVTNDAAAFQAAVDSGFTCYCDQPGTLLTGTTTIYMRDDSVFRGPGTAGLVIEYTGTGYALESETKTSVAISKLAWDGFTISSVNGGGLDLEGIFESQFGPNINIDGNLATENAGKFGLHTGWSAGTTGVSSYWLDIAVNRIRGFDEMWRADPNSNAIRFFAARFRSPGGAFGINIVSDAGAGPSSGITFTVLDFANDSGEICVYNDGRNVKGWFRHEHNSNTALQLGVNHRDVNIEWSTTALNPDFVKDGWYVDGIVKYGATATQTYWYHRGWKVEKYSKTNTSQQVEDTFFGSTLSHLWAASGNGSVALQDTTSGPGSALVSSGSTSADEETLQFTASPIRSPARNPSYMLVRLRLNTTTQQTVQFGFKQNSATLPLDVSQKGVWFENDPTSSAVNWTANQCDGTTLDSEDTGELADTSTHWFIIDMTEDGRGKFYIDNPETNDLTASGGTSTAVMKPFFYIATKENVDKNFDFEYFFLNCDIKSFS